jgi:hypothetical protein
MADSTADQILITNNSECPRMLAHDSHAVEVKVFRPPNIRDSEVGGDKLVYGQLRNPDESIHNVVGNIREVERILARNLVLTVKRRLRILLPECNRAPPARGKGTNPTCSTPDTCFESSFLPVTAGYRR